MRTLLRFKDLSRAVCLSAGLASSAAALELTFPADAQLRSEQVQPAGSYPVATGPFSDGVVPERRVEGRIRTRAWHLPDNSTGTFQLIAPLRDQLASQGFEVLYQCETEQCGGFDFRYALPTLPEPDMHVDLGDFQFLSAVRGTETVSLLVSKSATTGFIQETITTPIAALATANAPKDSDTATTMPAPAPQAKSSNPIGERLSSEGSVILEGVSFAPGSSSLEDLDPAMLTDLAQFLSANPEIDVAIIGHTDTSGSLEANIALSRKRAESVRTYMVEKLGVSAGQIAAHGAGYLAPIAPNQTEAGREKNRRVEVMVTSTR
jgi:outer membrane protein OmpA-like peptidoglycan-associated protein